MGSKINPKLPENRFWQDGRGSALVLVLVIVTCVTIICSAVVVGIFLQLKFVHRSIDQRQALYLAEAGTYKTIWYLSGHEGRGQYWRTKGEEIKLLDGSGALVSVEEWGGYLKVTSRVKYKHVTKAVRVLLGENPPPFFRQAVIIGGTKYPLVVTGKNRIIGNVTVGPKGVKEGHINGKGFEGAAFVEGKIFKLKNPQMPYFNSLLFTNAFRKYQSIIHNSSGERVFYSDLFIDRDFLNGVSEKRIFVNGNVTILDIDSTRVIEGPLMLCCSGDMLIKGKVRIRGYVELIAGGKLRVMDSVKIQNTILFGEKGIEVTDQCEITGQLLSPESIVLGGNVKLNYPSVVYCTGNLKDHTISGQLSLLGRAEVGGSIIFSPGMKYRLLNRDKVFLTIGNYSKLVGFLYSDYSTELQGTVIGNVTTKEFYLHVPPTIYLNWLRDATVNRSKLPNVFLMPLFFSSNPDLGIVQWEEVK